MFWSDRTAKEIIGTSEYLPYWVDDMFTPSGYAHIGSLRGPLVHDLVYRSLIDAGQKAQLTYVFNDSDPIDGLPDELKDKFSPYLGFPLRSVPSPDEKYASFGEYFAADFKSVLTDLGFRGKFISSWDMYHEGRFNGVIREALDHSEQILDIYQRVSGSKKREKSWLPLQVICEKCGRLGTTRVHDWDGQTVAYTCEPDMVTWARGCGFSGRVSPFDGRGKLPWKVDWPAHWKVLGVTVEGAGKDHSTAGGSRDIAKALCREVFNYPDPYNLPYEFFLIGGKKMSSSKGLGLKARDLTSVLPSDIARFLFIRTDYRQAIEFDPDGTMAIPDLFDEYDRCFAAFISGSDENLSRMFELSQTGSIPPKTRIFLPRFRDVANYIQSPSTDLIKKFSEIKGSQLTDTETEVLKERETYAKIWLDRFAPIEFRMKMTDSLPQTAGNITSEQKDFLGKVIKLLAETKDSDALQTDLYALAKSQNLNPKDAFAAIYLATLGKTYGPKAAWFMMQYPVKSVTDRLTQAITGADQKKNSELSLNIINKPELFNISAAVKKAFPTISVGFAIIRGINIEITNTRLEEEKNRLIKELSDLTTEKLSLFPEVTSYRKLYKEMGIDWHSRRPSPEALLRRVVLGKGLYTVNTCVDAYNLAVMQTRVSVGAFDANEISFPTALRFAGSEDSILLLGDKTQTGYKETELAYYDQKGGYNIDFNYRDAQRTKVTELTKNILINVDGVYDITPAMVQKTLDASLGLIIKYCGGTVEVKGVII